MTAKSRSAPSSWLDEVRSFSGQFGQVSILFSCSGGAGRISKLVTDSAPWRIEVPMQSEPVSPPPMTTTCLPSARIGSAPSAASPLTRRFCCGRKSMAKWTPLSSRPGTGRSRGFSAPPVSTTASWSARSFVGRHIDADMGAVMKHHAFGLHLRDAAVDVMLLHLEVGNAVAQQAAGLGVFLVDVNVVAGARELLRAGQARRARSRQPRLSCRFFRRRLGLSSPWRWRGRRWRIRSI